jgi:hypothetical protein
LNCSDEQLVLQTFSEQDAIVILRIPICEQHDDFIAWHFDLKGLFSVKSAYRVNTDMLQRQATLVIGESISGVSWRETAWKSIWSLNWPAKIHHFMWRFAHNSHLLRMNIARRGVELDTRCVVCGKLFEDGGHLFFRCKGAKELWSAAKLDHVRSDLMTIQSPLQIVEHIASLTEEERLKTVFKLWLWWTERNKANHSELTTVDLLF